MSADEDRTRHRVDALEEALAHSESTVQDLSDELAKQWKMIEGLVRKIAELEDKIEALSMAMPAPPGDAPPPHY